MELKIQHTSDNVFSQLTLITKEIPLTPHNIIPILEKLIEGLEDVDNQEIQIIRALEDIIDQDVDDEDEEQTLRTIIREMANPIIYLITQKKHLEGQIRYMSDRGDSPLPWFCKFLCCGGGLLS